MKNLLSKTAFAVLLTGGLVLGAGANANAGTHVKKAAKAQKSWFFSSKVECNSSGGARVVTRIFGINVGEGGTVENSAICQ